MREGELPRLAGDLVLARQLKLLGCQIEQVTVFVVIEQGVLFNTTRRVLLYVPGDPFSPWRAFESVDKLNRELGRCLRDKAYQRFFSRFVLRRDSQAFSPRSRSASMTCRAGLSAISNRACRLTRSRCSSAWHRHISTRSRTMRR